MKEITSLQWKVALIGAAISLTAISNGCTQNRNRAHAVTIGVSYQDLQNEFVIRLQDAMRAKAKELNVNLVELDAQGHAERQISHIENFIARNVDAIILNPEDQYGSSPAVDIAVREHKPIVVVNAIVANLDKASAYVGSPDVEAGEIEASEMARLLKGKGNVVILQGPYGHSAEVQRTKGIQDVLSKFPGIKIVAEQTGNWDRAQALSVMENWLSSGRPIDALIAENDEMALGALKAIEDAAKQKEIPVIGIDAIPDALQAVAEGTLIGTVFQDAQGQGATAVELADKLVKGEKVEHLDYIPFQLVTRANVSHFLEKTKAL
ncbi:MAG TPA: substrate-binding domain-containing protein [Bacteroidota bacterium]|nr:substrate-binding domain-containing protein [Bacteroidota bacterium]